LRQNRNSSVFVVYAVAYYPASLIIDSATRIYHLTDCRVEPGIARVGTKRIAEFQRTEGGMSRLKRIAGGEPINGWNIPIVAWRPKYRVAKRIVAAIDQLWRRPSAQIAESLGVASDVPFPADECCTCNIPAPVERNVQNMVRCH